MCVCVCVYMMEVWGGNDGQGSRGASSGVNSEL